MEGSSGPPPTEVVVAEVRVSKLLGEVPWPHGGQREQWGKDTGRLPAEVVEAAGARGGADGGSITVWKPPHGRP